MIVALITIFVIGYLFIALEHTLKINKSTFALIMCGVLWSIYSLYTHSIHEEAERDALLMFLGETCEILMFLIAAMTIVEHIDRYGGFSFITEHIHAKNKRKMLWLLSVTTFFMSAVLDNMTTTIIMIMMLRRLLPDQKERWIFAGVLVLAANSGGAWSPIGDVTTIMLWMHDEVTALKLIENLLLPSIISVAVPIAIASRWIKKEPMPKPMARREEAIQMSQEHPHISKVILILGVTGLLFVPVFKTITGLPPYMGMMLSLGVIWLVTEILITRYKIDPKLGGRVSQAMRNIDMSSILFFLGILMSVSALQHAGILQSVAGYLNTTIHEPVTIAGLIGVLSSIVDNVPLVAACINMFDIHSMTGPHDYLQYFEDDGLFWHLLTFTAGVGGSLLIIGSAAGVVAMGIEKIPFFWYLKKFTFIAFLGYLAGIAVIWLESLLPFMM